MRGWKNKVLGVLCLSLLWGAGCKKEEPPKVTDKVYKKEFRRAEAAITELQKLTQNSSMSQAKYGLMAQPRLEKAHIFIDKYKNTDLAIELDSYRALTLAAENYQVAQELWLQRKGLALVGDRWRMGGKMLQKASEAFKQEIGNVEDEDADKKK